MMSKTNQTLTRHAAVRQQQRGIPPMIIDLLLDYGLVERAGKGVTTYYFDRAARRKVLAYAGRLFPAVEQFLDYYAVVAADGRIITIAPRLKRVTH
jgi:hypothetical protein